MSKYGNETEYVLGIKFDSKKEAARYIELLCLERCGEIEHLETQKKFTLIPTQRDGTGKVIERECSYIADFVYLDKKSGQMVVEDVKGYRDTASAAYAKYTIKRKLMLYRYGIKIVEV